MQDKNKHQSQQGGTSTILRRNHPTSANMNITTTTLPLPRQAPDNVGSVPRVSARDRESIQQALQKSGCCICEAAASPTELREGVRLFWAWAEAQDLGIKRGQSSTLCNENWNRMCFPKNGVISGRGIGQSDFQWHCRLLPNVKKAFEYAWGDDDLITSFDGCGAYRDPWLSPGHETWLTTGGWFHLDQGPEDPGLTSYQGLLNFFPATASTGSTVLVPGSHRRFSEVFQDERRSIKNVRQGSVNYVKLTQAGDYDKYCTGAVQVEMQPGDLLLWDSRTIHCAQGVDMNAGRDEAMGFPETPERTKARVLARLVSYLCMVPRSHLRRQRSAHAIKR